MKLISKNLKLLPLLFVVFAFNACSDDDDNGTPSQPTTVDIVATAQTSADLTNLVAALQRADGDLVGLLQGPGPFTVLAPTNDAFVTFLEDNNFVDSNGDADLAAVPTDVLAEVLKNHVIAGELSANDLTTAGSGYDNTNAIGPDGNFLSIYFDTTNGVTFNGISTVVTGGADVQATNGVVHIVDAVITRPTIATFATANTALSSLVAALQATDADDSDDDYLDLVSDSEAGPFTVLAPTDAAFESLLLELDPSGNTGLGDVDVATVSGILALHVAAANVQSTGLASLNGSFPSLGGGVDLDATALTLTDANGRVSNILASEGLVDIQALNGVVHAIDNVLLPLQDDEED